MKTCRQISALVRLALLDLYRRKDLFVVIILAVLILAPLAFLSPYGVGGASRYLDDLAMLILWTASLALALGIVSRLFPPEFENRTIYPLMAKPIARPVLLLGKYLGGLAAMLSVLFLFYLLYAIMSGLRAGLWFPPVLPQAFIMHAACVALLMAVALLGSLILTPSANFTIAAIITVTMLIYGQRLPVLAQQQPPPARWILILLNWIGPHFEFFDLRQRVVHRWDPLPWSVCLAAILYALAYALVCLALSSEALRRRKLR